MVCCVRTLFDFFPSIARVIYIFATALHPPGLPMHVTNQGPLSVPSNGVRHSRLDDEVEPAIEKGAMIASTCKTFLILSENQVFSFITII